MLGNAYHTLFFMVVEKIIVGCKMGSIRSWLVFLYTGPGISKPVMMSLKVAHRKRSDRVTNNLH